MKNKDIPFCDTENSIRMLAKAYDPFQFDKIRCFSRSFGDLIDTQEGSSGIEENHQYDRNEDLSHASC